MEKNIILSGSEEGENRWELERDLVIEAATVVAKKERLEHDPDKYYDDERLRNNTKEVINDENFPDYFNAYWDYESFASQDRDMIKEFESIEKPIDFFKLSVNRAKKEKFREFSRLGIKVLEAALAIKSKKKGDGILPVAATYAKIANIIFY